MKKQKRVKYFAVFMILNIVFETISPSLSLALTNGPVQPEFGGFEPAGNNEMVDLFTGDFKYNIPLMDVDGYPLNLAYHAGQNMESEASWVGLGWSMNPGVLNRMMKGLPDDFNGDTVSSNVQMKPYVTTGSGSHSSDWSGSGFAVTLYAPLFSSSNGSGSDETPSMLIYNNYKGYGYQEEHDSHSSSGVGFTFESYMNGSYSSTVHSSQDGSSFGNATIQGSGYAADKFSKTSSDGVMHNTRTGADLKLSSSSVSKRLTSMISFGKGTAYAIPSGAISYAPKMPLNFTGGGKSKSSKRGLWSRASIGVSYYLGLSYSLTGGHLEGPKSFDNSLRGFSNGQMKSYGFLHGDKAGNTDLMDFNRFRDDAVFEASRNTSYANSTYDVFFAAAQGMVSTFRPFRSDIGTVHDPVTRLEADSKHDGTEFGRAYLLHKLKEKSKMNTTGESKSWNSMLDKTMSFQNFSNVVLPYQAAPFFKQMAPKAFKEKTYFKEIGELTERDEDFENSIGQANVVSPVLVGTGWGYNAFSTISGSGRQKRDIRKNHIRSLTASQADQYGFEPTINLYDRNSFSINNNTRLVSTSSVSANNSISRTSKSLNIPVAFNYGVSDHLSEISMTSSSGNRYIYGIPTYNLYSKKVIFNASDREEGDYQTFGTAQYYPATNYSINPLGKSDAYQIVQYDHSKEVQKNRRGKDNLSRVDDMSPYASSFLLTNILSSDYVDVTGNGPSYDDLGTYTKFNYSKEQDYQWRDPFCLDPASVTNTLSGTVNAATSQAHLDYGLISDANDDKAFYQYGARENYYLHSIESKNFVAFFKTSPRSDAMGVISEDGSMGTTPEMYKLDAIELYSKSEIIAKNGIANAIPVKTVHFEYDYSLCPGTFNTLTSNNPSRGKLTLKKVYFTYGTSKRASLSPYEFIYADNDHDPLKQGECNFAYDPAAIDRWGNYKPNNGAATGDFSAITLNNTEYPYAEQRKTEADTYAAAWNLTEIMTPSGSTIKITYESDDYAYVQNERAAQMCHIVNCVDNVNPTGTSPGISYSSEMKPDSYFILDLSTMSAGIPTTVPISTANEYFRNNVILSNKDDIYHEIYYKCFVHLTTTLGSHPKQYYDYVSGYRGAFLSSLYTPTNPVNTYYGTTSTSTVPVACYRYACISLGSASVYNNEVTNPVSYAGWEFLRHYNPALAYPGSEPANIGDPTRPALLQKVDAIAALEDSKVDMQNALDKKPYKRFYDKKFCDRLINGKSFFRLYCIDNRKMGGGHRVKRITTEDRWNEMTSTINSSSYSENSTIYTQAFDYTIQDGATFESSGVASYEPFVGGDENSMRKPLYFEVKHKYAPNDHFFQEQPLSEMLYPAPVVGYRKVTVRMIPDASSAACRNGKTEFEFYTAKDFPIQDVTTDLRQETFEKIPERLTLKKFINKLDNPANEAKKLLYMAQGNLVKLNDMHGKLKSVSHYGENNSEVPVSKVEYLYKCSDGENGKNLLCTTLTIDDKNRISQKVIARDIDVTVDSRENTTSTEVFGKSKLYEWGITVFPMLPLIVISPDLPTYFKNKFYGDMQFGYKGATITKVVQEYGILEKVVSTFRGSTTITENKLWDGNTGNVVLTKVTNGFNEPVYHFNYPAYWRYREMGSEFKRDGIILRCPQSSSSAAPLNSPLDVLTGELDASMISDPVILEIGDEVMVTDITAQTRIGKRFWVIRKPNTSLSAATYMLVDQQGRPLSPANYPVVNTHMYDIKLVRPINKNKLDASMGQVLSLSDPYNTSSNSIDYSQPRKILEAIAQEYCSGGGIYENDLYTGQTQVETNVSPNSHTAVINPVIAGTYGDHKPTGSYKYRVNRSYNASPDSKTDGHYTSFSPFWDYTPGNDTWKATAISSCSTNPNYGNWTSVGKNMYYSPYGQLLQSQNAIGINSATRYGFNHTLPVLNAYNATASEVGFESFEEYGQIYPMLGSVTSQTTLIHNNDYLGFYKATRGLSKPVFTNNAAHTGRYCLSFSANQTISMKHDIQRSMERTRTVYADDELYCTCMGLGNSMNCSKLSLDYKPYIVSMWVRGYTPDTDYSGLVSLSVSCTYSGTPTPATINNLKKSAVINGWQKLDFEIGIPVPSPTPLTTPSIEFSIGSGSQGFYMDDFRIQPFNSTMKCFVYDPYQLRLWAEMDDQNYATMYEYDNEGSLIRKKKETQKTIYTINESRTGIPKR